MRLRLLLVTARRVTFELENYGIWYADQPYEVYLNGELVSGSGRVVHSLGGLAPDTDYTLTVRAEDGEASVELHTPEERVTLNVRRFGAVGDGVADDTLAIQAAIAACPPKGRVLVPKGVYRVHCLFLKSDLVLELDEAATLLAAAEAERLPVLPGMVHGHGGEYNLGAWEGNPLDMYASLLTGIGVSNVVICGAGTLDGGANASNWWADPEGRAKFGPAWRPRMVFLNRCRDVTVQGLRIVNSPAWNLHPYFSDNTRWLDLRVESPSNSPNTDGMDPESVDGLEAVGIYFSLGDDCIAVKSGKLAMGKLYGKPSRNIEIRQCYMHRGHGSVTLGSELAAGITGLTVRDCVFHDTDRGLRIKTRRGRGRAAVIDGVVFENIRMRGVHTPVVVNCYYWCCDPDGKSDYVRGKKPLPVDERTPGIGSLEFRRIRAEDCQIAAAFVYGLPEAKIRRLCMEDVEIAFAADPQPGVPAMMADVVPCAKRGLFVRNVAELVLRDVRIEGQEGPAADIGGCDSVNKNTAG